jgi:hypothetical protein
MINFFLKKNDHHNQRFFFKRRQTMLLNFQPAKYETMKYGKKKHLKNTSWSPEVSITNL